ncbi:MAG TPA: SCO1664 family protein [Candidatus Limnocylindrales bacterium]|jgi:hypothetical protein
MPDADSVDSRDEPAADELGPADGGGASLTREEIEAAAMEGRQVAGQLDDATALRLLQVGEISVIGRLLSASNGTFFCLVDGPNVGRSGSLTATCVYKPIRGERPLIDFPDGSLACRELAAYGVSVASGWNIVPPTVMRDGPLGPGMVQLWVEVDPSVDVVELARLDLPELRRIAILDAVLNNADRKGGHLLPLPGGRIQAIDNGLCFSVEPKLRTILWRWRGDRFNEDEIAVLERLRAAVASGLGAELGELLAPAEVQATVGRIDALLSRGRFPLPDRNRPAIPWPPF